MLSLLYHSFCLRLHQILLVHRWCCLLRYVNVPTSSRVSPSSANELVFSVLYFMMLLFPLCMFRPTDAEAIATLFVCNCICSCICDRRTRLPAKSRLSRCVEVSYCIPCLHSGVEVFIIQLTTKRKRKLESKQPCLTAVFTWNASDGFPPSTALHCSPSYEFWMMLTIFSGTQ